MNFTQSTQLENPNILYVKSNVEGNYYSSLGIFISSVLLSCGGLISIVLSNLQKSKCKSINLGCITCDRDIDV